MHLRKPSQKIGSTFLGTETTEATALPREQFLPLESGQMPDSSPQQDHLWVGSLQIFFPQPKAYFTSMQARVTEWG